MLVVTRREVEKKEEKKGLKNGHVPNDEDLKFIYFYSSNGTGGQIKESEPIYASSINLYQLFGQEYEKKIDLRGTYIL